MSIQKKDLKLKTNFSSIRIGLASPEVILERSHGEVVKPETINYRTYKPEMGGLFCERIFGPTKDYECHCGKYKRIRYKNIVCDRCGVEVTEKKVRRERMGHIKLVVPVAHIWYFRSLPNKIGYLLGMQSKKLDMVIYYERYIVVNAGIKSDSAIKNLDLLTEEEYLDIIDTLPRENQLLDDSHPDKFLAMMGAEALQLLLSRIKLEELMYQLKHQADTENSQQRKTEALKRLKIVTMFVNSNRKFQNLPEWMVINMVPVIPPELRPLVPLEGGRFATSDLNDLYRRVIIRNNRLKRLMEIKAPDVILRNEKRMLQEAVDSLFDNSRKVNAVKTEGNRALKSLSDMLKGKQGRFRQNLLGKRVDYSGRSVIVVGPKMKLHECGIPKDMAAELYKPFIIRKMIERGIVKTVKSAKKIVDRKDAVVWDILENVLKGHPVMLNRAPTLHRLGIQSFQPRLIEGKAIQLHPLVCTAFNADFDGDQMAVHVPLGNAAILEAQLLMLASHNILNPANGSPITVPSQDMVLGLYYMTKGRRSTEEVKVRGEGLTFYAYEEAVIAYNERRVELHAYVKIRAKVTNEAGELEYKIIETTVGRILFNQAMPPTMAFVNKILTKKTLRDLIGDIVHQINLAETAHFLDEIKDLGFKMAFEGGLSFNLGDVLIPDVKVKLVKETEIEIAEIGENFNLGYITNNERYNAVIDAWTRTNSRITDTLMREISSHKQGFNSIYMMLDSGARGSKEQIRQLGGMRGLMAKPQKSGGGGSIIENPILSNFKEGLNVLEYFISTHGARKGLADTALKTADAGYLTRRLHDVAQDVVVNITDCGTLRGIQTLALKDNEEVVETLAERIVGRVSTHDIIDPLNGKLILAQGGEITEAITAKIDATAIEMVEIRSVLTCEAKQGVCVKCYGRNLSTNKMVQIGEAAGVIAAQSIGEPGTQLTLRTFHTGGTASNVANESQITAKFDGIIQLEDVRSVPFLKGEDQTEVVLTRAGEMRLLHPETNQTLSTNNVPYGSFLYLKNGDSVKKGDRICSWDPYNAVIVSEFKGKVAFESVIENVTFREESDEQSGYKEKVIIDTRDKTKNPTINVEGESGTVLRSYNIPVGAHLSVENGELLIPGQILVKIPRTASKSRDITGGLPRVTELFEARNPSNPAVVSEIDGEVSFGGVKRGNKEISVRSKEGELKKYLVPLSKHILVQENDFIKAGMPLSDGAITPTSILDIKGPSAVQEYLVNGIQEVYRLQGVKINDKHFEVIVRQMMQKVRIVDSGDTTFLQEELVDKMSFKKQNDWIYGKRVITEEGSSKTLRVGQITSLRKIRDENSVLKRNDQTLVQYREALPATASPVLQGITRASLGTSSFISAASFQETTKVLNEAAIAGKTDYLKGLKENVIVGHLIPAGTGVRRYENIEVEGND